jgi:hypothetical protein
VGASVSAGTVGVSSNTAAVNCLKNKYVNISRAHFKYSKKNSCQAGHTQRKSDACSKFLAASFLLINTQEELDVV